MRQGERARQRLRKRGKGHPCTLPHARGFKPEGVLVYSRLHGRYIKELTGEKMTVKECAIVVPGFFTQLQRQAVR